MDASNYSEGILAEAKFFFDDAREVWINRHRRMAFSHEALRVHDSEWVKRKLLENVPMRQFRFYRTSPNPTACRETLERLEMRHLKPVELLN